MFLDSDVLHSSIFEESTGSGAHSQSSKHSTRTSGADRAGCPVLGFPGNYSFQEFRRHSSVSGRICERKGILSGCRRKCRSCNRQIPRPASVRGPILKSAGFCAIDSRTGQRSKVNCRNFGRCCEQLPTSDMVRQSRWPASQMVRIAAFASTSARGASSFGLREKQMLSSQRFRPALLQAVPKPM